MIGRREFFNLIIDKDRERIRPRFRRRHRLEYKVSPTSPSSTHDIDDKYATDVIMTAKEVDSDSDQIRSHRPLPKMNAALSMLEGTAWLREQCCWQPRPEFRRVMLSISPVHLPSDAIWLGTFTGESRATPDFGVASVSLYFSAQRLRPTGRCCVSPRTTEHGLA